MATDKDRTTYRVDLTADGVAEARSREPLKRVAVFVAHGMGQQIPFQTLDAVAEGLRTIDAGAGSPGPTKPVSRAVKFKDQWFQRIEMRLNPGDAKPVDVHVYEGYWAPLTEGKVTLRNVIGFLASAAANGINNARHGTFKRWMFDSWREFPIASRTLLYLIVALATVGALVVMNTTIAVVAAGRALLSSTPQWLSDGLFADLTTTFNVVLTAMALFGASLGIATLLRKAPAWLRTVWSLSTIGTFVSTIATIILAGIALPLLFYGHIRGAAAPGEQLWHRILPGSASSIATFNQTFSLWAWRAVLAAAAVMTLVWAYSIARGVIGDLGRKGGRVRTAFIALVFLGLVAAAYGLVRQFMELGNTGDVLAVRSGLAWALLVVASVFIRKVLVQFVGDVAAYVMSFKLDAFADLRREIKECVYKVAHGIYDMARAPGADAREYDQVIVVGHSLGSVIAYDVLNQLIREDEAANRALRVVDRTPLLLTFGSPLDKTAFIFGLQGKKTTEARESLAASVQPMIIDYKYRPTRWINVYSPWDIISGSLGFYDLEETEETKKVRNDVDPGATTLLMAHTEYWDTGRVFRWIYAAIAEKPELFPDHHPVGGSHVSIDPGIPAHR